MDKKFPQSAGKIARRYGGRDALRAFDEMQQLQAQREKDKLAVDKERSLIPIRAATAGAEEAARLAAGANAPALTAGA